MMRLPRHVHIGLDWVHYLPSVILGLSTTPKEGRNISSAEMVHGQHLVVLGYFFSESSDTNASTEKKLQDIHWAAQHFTPFLPTSNTHRDTYVHKSLETGYLFIRHDLVKP